MYGYRCDLAQSMLNVRMLTRYPTISSCVSTRVNLPTFCPSSTPSLESKCVSQPAHVIQYLFRSPKEASHIRPQKLLLKQLRVQVLRPTPLLRSVYSSMTMSCYPCHATQHNLDHHVCARPIYAITLHASPHTPTLPYML